MLLVISKFVHIITAYLFPKYEIKVILLLVQQTDTLSLEMKILYWIGNKQLLDV
jgi:hypothetical protein